MTHRIYILITTNTYLPDMQNSDTENLQLNCKEGP